MALKRIVAPAVPAVSLTDAKHQCRVEHGDDDAYLTALVAAAISHLDGWRGTLGRCLVEQTWELHYDAFPCDALRIPLGNLIAVDAVAYADPDTGNMVAWPDTNYEVDAVSLPGWVKPVESWPATMDTMNAMRVTFRAGFGPAASDVPEALRHAILMLVGHWYANRETVTIGQAPATLPLAFEALVAPYRLTF